MLFVPPRVQMLAVHVSPPLLYFTVHQAIVKYVFITSNKFGTKYLFTALRGAITTCLCLHAPHETLTVSLANMVPPRNV